MPSHPAQSPAAKPSSLTLEQLEQRRLLSTSAVTVPVTSPVVVVSAPVVRTTTAVTNVGQTPVTVLQTPTSGIALLPASTPDSNSAPVADAFVGAFVGGTALSESNGPVVFTPIAQEPEAEIPSITLKVSDPTPEPAVNSAVEANESGDLMDYLDQAMTTPDAIPTNSAVVSAKPATAQQQPVLMKKPAAVSEVHTRPTTEPTETLRTTPPVISTPAGTAGMVPQETSGVFGSARIRIPHATPMPRVMADQSAKTGTVTAKRAAGFGAALVLIAKPRERAEETRRPRKLRRARTRVTR